jgi:hypothetical protein
MSKLRILVLCVMFMALGGQAFAYFDSFDLVLNVYYDEGTTTPSGKEIAVDLSGAAVGTPDLTQQNVTLAAAGTINLSDLGVSDWSLIRAGAWGKSGNLYGNAYFATALSEQPSLQSNPTPFFSATTQMYAYYSGEATSAKYVADNTMANSYDNKLNSTSDIPGYYAGMNMSSGTGNPDASLSALDGVATFVDLYLWNAYKPTAGAAGPAAYYIPGQDTDYAAIIRIFIDGSVVLNPTAVPIPASLLLFGSGLLGFVGLRRKTA